MKLKYLLPIATIASIGTIVTPLVSCGDNGGDTPEPGKIDWDDFKILGPNILSKNKIKLTAGQEYTAHLSAFPKDDCKALQLYVVDIDEQAETMTCYDFTESVKCTLLINGQKVDDLDYENPSPGSTFLETEWDSSYQGKEATFTFKCVSDFDNAQFNFVMAS